MASADGYRLAFADRGLPDGFPQLLIPATGVRKAAEVLAPDGVTLHVHPVDEKPPYVVFRGRAKNPALAKAGAHVDVVVHTEEGEFPDYQPIVPSEESLPVVFTVSVADLASAAKALKDVVAKGDSASMVYGMTREETLVLSTVEGVTCSQELVVPVRGLTRATAIAFDINFLVDAMASYAALGAAEVIMRVGLPEFCEGKWKSVTSPLRIDGPLTWVIMPMHPGRVLEWQGDPEVVREYAEPLVNGHLTVAAGVLGYAISPPVVEAAVAHMVDEMKFDLRTAAAGAGWLDPLTAEAERIARQALETIADDEDVLAQESLHRDLTPARLSQ